MDLPDDSDAIDKELNGIAESFIEVLPKKFRKSSIQLCTGA